VGGGRSHDNTAQSSGTGNARANGPSSPSDTAGENEHAVRLVGQRAAESETEAGEISRVAHQLGSGAESHRSGSARPTSTKLDPGVTSDETARIRDRMREPGAPPSERDPHVKPRRSSRPQRPPATSLARPRGTPGAPPSPSAARSGDPHTDVEAASRQPSARAAGTQS